MSYQDIEDQNKDEEEASKLVPKMTSGPRQGYQAMSTRSSFSSELIQEDYPSEESHLSPPRVQRSNSLVLQKTVGFWHGAVIFLSTGTILLVTALWFQTEQDGLDALFSYGLYCICFGLVLVILHGISHLMFTVYRSAKSKVENPPGRGHLSAHGSIRSTCLQQSPRVIRSISQYSKRSTSGERGDVQRQNSEQRVAEVQIFINGVNQNQERCYV